MQNALRLLRILIAASLAVSTALFVVWSRHWPLVGDATLIHYIGFLIEHGRAPYRQLGDMNMPGSFLIEMAAMKVFGDGATGWRVFDLSLLAVTAGSYFVVTRRAGWFAAVFAGTMFALIHGRDGLAQGGQRDLTMAVLLVASTAALFVAIRRRSSSAMVIFGLLAGAALTIKPTALPLSLAQLAITTYVLRRPMSQVRNTGQPVLLAALGMIVAPLVSLAFLVHEGAVRAFWVSLHTVVPYYASLGHRKPGFLLLHSVSPILPLALVWLAVVALARPRIDWERGLLLCGAAFGWASYIVQARGWPYHRYPLLAFLLPLMALDLTEAMALLADRAMRMKAAATLAMAALCFGGFGLGPQSARLVHSYRWWQTGFITGLEANLNRLGGAQLSGSVQCIDWFSGCGATLYRMRLMPSTGVLSDFLLFGPADEPAVAQSRAQFGEAFAHPPRVIVVTDVLQFDGPGEYRKLDLWPDLRDFLAEDYRLETQWTPTRTERWWSRDELPAGYRIYIRKEP